METLTKTQSRVGEVNEAQAAHEAASFSIKNNRTIDKNGDALKPVAPKVEASAAPKVHIEVQQDEETEVAFKVTDNRSHDKYGNRLLSADEIAAKTASETAKANSEAAKKAADTEPAAPAFAFTDNRRFTPAGVTKPVTLETTPVAAVAPASAVAEVAPVAEEAKRYGRIRSKLAAFSVRRAGVEAPAPVQAVAPAIESPVFGPQTEQQAAESAAVTAAEQAAAPVAQAQQELIIAKR
jgi:hypothetical protein